MIDKEKLRFVLTLFSSSEATTRRSRNEALKWLRHLETPSKSKKDWANLLSQLVSELSTTGRLPGPEINELIEDQISRLQDSLAGVVTIYERMYPRRLRETLGDGAPTFLFFRGNAELFDEIATGFCGSRHASDKGLEVCGDIVKQLVDHRVTIVAGYAAGVDQVAHLTALRAGGKTIAVLAEGILNFGVRQILESDWDWSRSLVVSEFLPQSRWTAPRAMQRNRTIVGLGRALVVIEAKESGGTFEAGKEALALRHPLFAPIYENIEAQGNQILIAKGATPIMKSRSTGRAKLGELMEHLTSDEISKVEQKRLSI